MGSFTCGIIMKNHKLYIFVILIHAIFGDEIEEEKELKQEGRQFFVTTTTATTTLSTIKFCWVQTATATGVYRCKREARMMNFIDEKTVNLPDNLKISPNPSEYKVEDSTDEMDDQEVLSSSLDARQAKFLHYWMTISETFTITSYTTTSTFGSVYCTPLDFVYSACPVNGTGKKK